MSHNTTRRLHYTPKQRLMLELLQRLTLQSDELNGYDRHIDNLQTAYPGLVNLVEAYQQANTALATFLRQRLNQSLWEKKG